MDENMLDAGKFYRHFSGKIYQLKCVARQIEDEKKIAVCQAMQPPFDMWAVPVGMFEGSGDEKPAFVRIGEDEILDAAERGAAAPREEPRDAVSDEEVKAALIDGAVDRRLAGRLEREQIAQRGFMAFLDAETYHEKYLIFLNLRDYLDKRMLNNIAAALDVVLDDGDIDEQYDSILNCLRTLKRYETGRLRRE